MVWFFSGSKRSLVPRMADRRVVRCAIYTRKSSEDGLEQDFNSLDAQREACAAYIASQKHEGWKAVAQTYDDGGFSGGSMQRPGLAQLMSDIKARRVDVIVVYKVDRLTRSLADFAKIVDILDAHQASFVSVTQQFNTTTSMGRLTLNVLLSFAQFEREIASERIRDKIKASRQKGMWMGGTVPLGYEVRNRALVIKPAEAEIVRMIFQRYLDLGSVYTLADELSRSGIRSPHRFSQSGHASGNRPITRGNLYLMLTNQAYIGMAVHKGTPYPGLHQPIIGRAQWDLVQQMLTDHRVERRNGTCAVEPSLLAGMIFDDAGQRLTPSHAVKSGRRYRYYVSRALITKQTGGLDNGASTRWRIPAIEIESAVIAALQSTLADANGLLDFLSLERPDPAQVERIINSAAALANRLDDQELHENKKFVSETVSKVVISDTQISITLHRSAIHKALSVEPPSQPVDALSSAQLNLPIRVTKRGVEQKLIIRAGVPKRANVDEALIKAIARAHCWLRDLKTGAAPDITVIARREKIPASYAQLMLPLAFLAPSIVTAILEGHQPADLSLDRLIKRTTLALDWSAQRQHLGFSG
ncbi:MAG: recombinase family protein [Hyphomicrobium sp.]